MQCDSVFFSCFLLKKGLSEIRLSLDISNIDILSNLSLAGCAGRHKVHPDLLAGRLGIRFMPDILDLSFFVKAIA